jgi:hypothetical protein
MLASLLLVSLLCALLLRLTSPVRTFGADREGFPMAAVLYNFEWTVSYRLSNARGWSEKSNTSDGGTDGET